MEEKIKLSPDSFQPLPKEEELDNEKIAAPSLTFTQDAWRRLKKNKGAVISLFIILIMVIIAFGSTPFIDKSTLVKSAPQYANLPARVPGLDFINGLNGKLKVGGQWVDQYAQNGASGKYFYLGTDYLGRS